MNDTLFFPGWGVPLQMYATGNRQILNWGFFPRDKGTVSPLEPLQTLYSDVTLEAHSMGILLAVQTALHHPGKVKKLILHAPFLQFTQGGGTPGHPPEAVESMLRQCQNVPERMLKAFWRNVFAPEAVPPALTATVEKNTARLIAGLELLRHGSLVQELEQLNVEEVIVSYGTEDRIVSSEMTESFLEHLPPLKLTVQKMPGNGHFLKGL